MAEEDRNKLFDEIRNFSQRKLKKVETKVTTGSGEQLTEKRSPKGLQQIKSDGINSVGYVVDNKPDLQVGMIIPGLLISSQDVAQDKSLLDTYEITHILNLAPGVPNAFEDDFNYKKFEVLDIPETDITQYFDECIDFIQEGIQRGNCLVHCNAGVSRSTAICCAYLMKQKKMKYKDALATIREARAFAKPNDGFAKQLEQYEDQLFGQMAAPDSSEDKFMARKRAEIEAEKAAISGTSSVKNKLAQFGAQLESVYAQRLQTMTPIKLPLKKKTPSTQPQQQPQSIVKNRKKSNATATIPPPPPPPPLSELSNKNVPPPPPPPNSLLNNDRTTPSIKKTTTNKVITNENKTNIVKPIKEINNQKQSGDPPRRTAKSDMVDETPIKVAAQKKLWESAHNQQPENNNVQNKKPIKFKTQPQVTQTIAKPSPPISQPQLQATDNKTPNKSPARSNKLGTWEKCPSSTPAPSTVANPNTKAEIASPEPKKKITIKKKDANNNIISGNEFGQSRRSTRDLAAAIEASATDSNSSTPFSSPGTQRRQMYYGRRTSTQPIASQQPSENQQQPVASRKPTWGLRDQVDNLMETTPSSTPTRCRSPALVPTPRDSHSPSPQPVGGMPTGKKVFGRVPPRRTSLSGNGPIGQNTVTNDFVPISPPPIMVSDDSIGQHDDNDLDVDQFLRKPLSMMIDRMNFSRSPSPINTTNETTVHVDYLPVNNNRHCKNQLQQQQFDRSSSLSSGYLDYNAHSLHNNPVNHSLQQLSYHPKRSLSPLIPFQKQSKPLEFHPQNQKPIFRPQKQPENYSYFQQPQTCCSATKTLSKQQQQARAFIQQQLEAPMNFAPLVRRHTTNDRIWANRDKNSSLSQQQSIHTPAQSSCLIINGCQTVADPRSEINDPFDSNRRDQLAQSMFLQQIEPSFGRQAITPPPGRMFIDNRYKEQSPSVINNNRPISPNILMRSSLPKIMEDNNHCSIDVSSSPKPQPLRLVFNRSASQPMNSISNSNLFNTNTQQLQPEQLVVIRRLPASHQNICFATDY
nr:uncharacterized protein LOC124492999 isoform X1 [Dermatophagoides farinae]XP_046912000.1 uncharacterized protein LOC124492999 isoform X1 [Dermatophagoides farinae]XP_046912008.1 uncharacterized protein LOC124492999 isoform X1 [Dermatophagoides farinae]